MEWMFDHVSLLVADVVRARHFYEQVLGLVPSPLRPVMSFDGVWYDLNGAQLHLLCLPNPEAGLARPLHGGRDRHVAFRVQNLDALCLRLQTHGVAYTLSLSGRQALFCRDPDDNALEIMVARA